MLVDKFPDIEPQLDFFENAFITADVEIDCKLEWKPIHGNLIAYND